MTVVRMRPRFAIETREQPRELLCRLREALDRSSVQVEGDIFGNHAVLRIPDEQAHYWSPQLSIDFDPGRAADRTIVRGLFAPRPSIWTLFVALYSMFIFCGLMGIVVGFSQWTLGNVPTFLWLVPVSSVLCLCVYGLALYGQRLGNDQMVVLRNFLDGALAGRS